LALSDDYRLVVRGHWVRISEERMPLAINPHHP
jgi:hypothetical protein